MVAVRYQKRDKEIKEELNKLRDIPCLWIKDNIVKVYLLPNLIYRFSEMPVNIPTSFLMYINKIILEFIREAKDPD